MWSSISWPSRNVCFEVSKRGEQKSLWVNVPLPCDLRSADRVATFASKWAKEVNRLIVYNVPLACDLRSADRVATFASKWGERLNWSSRVSVWSTLVWSVLKGWEKTIFFKNLNKIVIERSKIVLYCLLGVCMVSVLLVGAFGADQRNANGVMARDFNRGTFQLECGKF